MFLLLQRRFALEFVQNHGRRIQKIYFWLTRVTQKRRCFYSLLNIKPILKRQNENIEGNPSAVLAQLPFVVSFIGKSRGGANWIRTSDTRTPTHCVASTLPLFHPGTSNIGQLFRPYWGSSAWNTQINGQSSDECIIGSCKAILQASAPYNNCGSCWLGTAWQFSYGMRWEGGSTVDLYDGRGAPERGLPFIFRPKWSPRGKEKLFLRPASLFSWGLDEPARPTWRSEYSPLL